MGGRMEANLSESFAKLLRHYIGESGQGMVARKTGVSQSTVSRYLSGDSEPRMSDLIKIARAIELDPGDFFEQILGRQKPGPSWTDQVNAALDLKTKILSDEMVVDLSFQLPDAAGGAEILSKYQGLSPSLKKLACAVLYEKPTYLKHIPPQAGPLLARLLEAFQKQIQSL